MGYPVPIGRNKRNLWRIILGILLLVSCVFILFKSSLFDVRKIEVKGNNQLSREQIISASGLTTGVNIFNIDLKEAGENLKALPILKNARLERDLPGGIIIIVEERVPVGLLPTGNGFIEIDKDRVYIQKNKLVNNLPVITGIDAGSVGPGEVIKGQDLEYVTKVISELPQQLTNQLSEIHYQSDGSIVIYTDHGVQCRMGSPRDIPVKAEIFMQLLIQLEHEERGIEYVDLSYAGSPVVKYKN